MSYDLVVASCYNQKPFYMISSKCEKVSWDPVTKKVWSSSLKSNVDFKFLRWSLSHDYNYQIAEACLLDHALSKEQQVVVGIVFVGLRGFDGEFVCVDEAVL